MKRIIVLALFIQLFTLGCGKDKEVNTEEPVPPEPVPVPTLEISENEFTIQAEGGELEFNIVSNSDWSARSSNSWCKLSSEQGYGDRTISITVLPFEEYDERSAEITIKVDTIVRIISVIQKQKNALVLSDNHFDDIPVEGKEISVEVKSNIDYEIIIPNEFKEWIKQILPSRALEKNNYKFEIIANPLFDERKGFVIFKDVSNILNDTVFITQRATIAVLNIINKNHKVSVEGGEITTNVTSNIDIEVYIPDEFKSWIKSVQTYELEKRDFIFKIEGNEECESKKGIVILKNEFHNLSDTIFIEQEINTSERAVLVTFYKSLKGDQWSIKTNWLSDKPIGEWYGITTNTEGHVVKIDFSRGNWLKGKIGSYIEYLDKLEYLNCEGDITFLEIENLPNLKTIIMSAFNISIKNCPNLISIENDQFKLHLKGAFEVDNCENLNSIKLSGQGIFIDFKLSRCPNLTNLHLSKVKTVELDLTSFKKLTKLRCQPCEIDYLNAEGLPNLKEFYAQSGKITKMNFKNCPSLEDIDSHLVSVTEIEVNNCRNLKRINLWQNKLKYIDVSSCQKLESLDCKQNQLYDLKLNTNLITLTCNDNQIQSLDLSQTPNLRSLYCENNKLITLDITPTTNLYSLNCLNNPISVIWTWEGFDPEKGNIKAPEGVEYKVKQ